MTGRQYNLLVIAVISGLVWRWNATTPWKRVHKKWPGSCQKMLQWDKEALRPQDPPSVVIIQSIGGKWQRSLQKAIRAGVVCGGGREWRGGGGGIWVYKHNCISINQKQSCPWLSSSLGCLPESNFRNYSAFPFCSCTSLLSSTQLKLSIRVHIFCWPGRKVGQCLWTSEQLLTFSHPGFARYTCFLGARTWILKVGRLRAARAIKWLAREIPCNEKVVIVCLGLLGFDWWSSLTIDFIEFRLVFIPITVYLMKEFAGLVEHAFGKDGEKLAQLNSKVILRLGKKIYVMQLWRYLFVSDVHFYPRLSLGCTVRSTPRWNTRKSRPLEIWKNTPLGSATFKPATIHTPWKSQVRIIFIFLNRIVVPYLWRLFSSSSLLWMLLSLLLLPFPSLLLLLLPLLL